MEPIGSLVSFILGGLVIAGSIALPVLLIIFIVRVARNSVTPQQREMQRLLAEAVELLRQNNELLRAQSEGSAASSREA